MQLRYTTRLEPRHALRAQLSVRLSSTQPPSIENKFPIGAKARGRASLRYASLLRSCLRQQRSTRTTLSIVSLSNQLRWSLRSNVWIKDPYVLQPKAAAAEGSLELQLKVTYLTPHHPC